MTAKPKLKAPGLQWRRVAAGWEARWRAQSRAIKAGVAFKSHRIWIGAGEPNELQAKMIVDDCVRLQNEMIALAGGRLIIEGLPAIGTLDRLIHAYRTDTLVSSFHKTTYATRQSYSKHLRHIRESHGQRLLTQLKARDLMIAFQTWKTNNGLSTARYRIAILRAVFTYGLNFSESEAEQEEAARLSHILRQLEFETLPSRNQHLTADQANLIRAMAWQMRMYPSIALAQAIQFECSFRQKDVIGEWVPIAEKEVSDIIADHRGQQWKWIRGLRWQEIDKDFLLVHRTSKRGKVIAIPLLLCPMVVDELARLAEVRPQQLHRDLFPANGPVIVCERDELPWDANEFRRWWRKTARQCGIPDSVLNMDTRAGAATEAELAGVPLDERRAQLTHSSSDMTLVYSRGEHEKVVRSLQARTAHRNRED